MTLTACCAAAALRPPVHGLWSEGSEGGGRTTGAYRIKLVFVLAPSCTLREESKSWSWKGVKGPRPLAAARRLRREQDRERIRLRGL